MGPTLTTGLFRRGLLLHVTKAIESRDFEPFTVSDLALDRTQRHTAIKMLRELDLIRQTHIGKRGSAHLHMPLPGHPWWGILSMATKSTPPDLPTATSPGSTSVLESTGTRLFMRTGILVATARIAATKGPFNTAFRRRLRHSSTSSPLHCSEHDPGDKHSERARIADFALVVRSCVVHAGQHFRHRDGRRVYHHLVRAGIVLD